jgi:heme A synthase
MLARMIEGLKDSTSSAIRLTSLLAVLAAALLVTIGFLSAAAVISVLNSYGPVEACLTGAAIFLLIALIAAALYVEQKKRARVRAQEAVKSPLHSALTDPVVVATGIQVARAIGVRNLIPILALGGLALGLFASRSHSSDEAPAE